MKKVLNVVSVFFSIPFFFGDQIKHFTSKGYDITLVCSPSNKIASFANKQNAHYKEIPILRKFSVFQDIKSLFILYRYIKNNKFDIVCGHTPKGALIAMLASFIARTPKRVFFRHGLVYETTGGLKRFVLINMERITSFCATQVVCVSPYLVERSLKDHLTRKNKMLVLHKGSCNGVDCVKKFNPQKYSEEDRSSFKQSLGLSENSYVIGYTGRLVHDKGIEELVDGFLLLQKRFNDVFLLLVGPLEDKDPLSERTKRILQNNKNIVMTGMIDNEIEKYYSIMNVLVLATYREGFGTCILEASAMGVPVLTTSHTGSRDAIINQKTGLYIDLSAQSISSTIEVLIKNSDFALELGEQGRQYINENFEQHIVWEEIENHIYKS